MNKILISISEHFYGIQSVIKRFTVYVVLAVLYDQPSKLESITLIKGTRLDIYYNIHGIKVSDNGGFKIRLNGKKFSNHPHDYVRNTNEKNGNK